MFVDMRLALLPRYAITTPVANPMLERYETAGLGPIT